MIITLLFTGCASAKQDNTDASSATGATVPENATKEAVAIETESAENIALAETEDSVPMSESPTTSGWEIVVESPMFKDSNFEGFLNENFGISVGYAGAISYTEDGAKTWTEGENSSLCRFCLDIVDENLAWCGGNGNNVRVTKDGGKTWSEVSDAVLSSTHSNIDFLDDTTGWVVSGKKCAATNDGGTTWTFPVLPEGIDNIAAIALRTASDIYILDNKGLLYITSDGGSTWTNIDIKLADFGVTNEKGEAGLYKYKTTIADMNFYDENNGMLVFSGIVPGEGTKLWSLTTQDGGDTWITEEIPLKDGFKVNKVFLSGDGNYITLGDITKNVMVLAKK